MYDNMWREELNISHSPEDLVSRRAVFDGFMLQGGGHRTSGYKYSGGQGEGKKSEAKPKWKGKEKRKGKGPRGSDWDR